MGEHLIKPYEISVWEDRLIQSGATYNFEEVKLAVIGSDTMTGLNKIYNPVFHKKINGEKTLSFSLRYKYFDPYIGNDEIVNPFAALLINERKIKLYYDEQWYEFVIKDHMESSDGLEWTYTCSDAFVLELSKNGYNLTFDSELNNNQGTAYELAKKTLQDTDWQIGGVDNLKQLIAEPVYNGITNVQLSVLDTDTNTTVNIPENTEIYVFYSYIKNRDGKFIQFIKKVNSDLYKIDSNNVVTITNYRIISNNVTVSVIDENVVIKSGNETIITIGEIETQFQVNRLAYNQLTTYDPVMEKTVDRYQVQNGDLEIYKYTDYEYTTSNVIMNFITNGDNFNELEDGSLQGWNPYTDQSDNTTVHDLELVTKPELGTGKQLADLAGLTEVEGFLKIQFNGTAAPNPSSSNKVYNTVYNSGIENNASFIQSISRGDKFVFRWRAATGTINSLADTTNLRLIVAKYTQDTPTRYGYYYKHIKASDIIINFDGTIYNSYNIITGGQIEPNQDGTYSYVINGVAQVPSTKYIYKVGDKEYIWNGKNGNFIIKPNNYRPYHYMIGTARKAISNSVLTDPNTKIGIFIYTIDDSLSTYYIQDIQLMRFVPDSADSSGQTPILIGNIPTATSNLTEYYYVKPGPEDTKESIVTYTSLENLKSDRGIASSVSIKPLYNEDSEKHLTISASQSNCFNILQTIAETFECWIDLVVEHENNGAIQKINGIPQKYVYLREYAGKDNQAGFKYGINLNSIERTINSEEIVTKLIVNQSQSEYTDEGFISITNAPSNQSGESYILNFDYYYNQGLLNRNTAEADKLKFITDIIKINNKLQNYNKQYRDYSLSLTELESKRNVYTELVTTAQDMQNEALADFEKLTGESYTSYKQKHGSLIEQDDTDGQLTEEDTILDVLGKLYTSSATINNYSGLLTNVEQEYLSLRKKIYGAENYYIKIWTEKDFNGQRHVFIELNDYLPGIVFTFNNQSYTTTISNKFFDIINNNSTQIVFTQIPAGYVIDQEIYNIVNNKVAKIKVLTTSSVRGIKDFIEDEQDKKIERINQFNNKYSRFIQEGTWSSTDYIDSERYYLAALQVSNTSAQPTVSYSINVVEISELDGFEWYKFDTGDKTYVEDTEFFGWSNVDGILTPAREEVIVSEIEWHLDRPEENIITIQNYKTRFEDLFQRISAAVQTVQYNETTYAKMSSLLDVNGTLNQNVLLESLNKISGQNYNLTSDGSVMINGDQILVQNLTNPANRVIINSEGLRISSDGGQTWKTAIDGQGINIGTVYTGTLNTENVIIGSSENPSFRWDKSGISAYKKNLSTGIYDLQTYVRYDEFGLYGIKNGASFKARTIEDVLNKAHFAVTWDGFFIKNSYPGGGKVEITSDNDFRVLKANNIEKIKIGALEWKPANWQDGDPIYTDPETLPDNVRLRGPSLYGIRIKNNAGDTVMKTGDDGNLSITGDITATTGHIGGMVVNNNKLTMNTIVLEPGVGIYSKIKVSDGQGGENPIFSISDINGFAVFRHIDVLGGTLGFLTVTDAITVGQNNGLNTTGLIKSANYEADQSGWLINAAGYAEFANAKVRGHIEAETGDFTGWVAVGDRSQNALTNPWIVISGGVTGASQAAYGSKAIIQTSNYSDGASYGWMINSDGDAVFNNITARGAIKTAVFEYAEIQAVGGIFIFRPSSTIRSAQISGTDLIIKVEKPALFAKLSNQQYSWCKISNYTNDGTEPNIDSILTTNGLTHIYQISNVNLNTAEITLNGAKAFIDAVKQIGQTDEQVLNGLIGGALIDMGREDGTSNYGIGVNSSDNTVNLPARAISLFETVVDKNQSIKVSYNYRGILGTLPNLNADKVSSYYSSYLAGTQGIYTDNMYIGDKDQYIAFYTDSGDIDQTTNKPKKKLRIKAKEIIYGITDGREVTWEEKINDIETTPGPQGPPGESAKFLQLTSTGSHFTYRYTGSLFGNKELILIVQATGIEGIHWYCDDVLIYSSNGQPTIIAGNEPYSEISLSIAGDNSVIDTKDIHDLSSEFNSNKVAQFKIVETDANGNEVVNGLVDYFSVYAYFEAQPGDDVYTAFLDNDEEIVSVFNNVPDLTGAISTFYINKSGVSDIANWTINITDSNTSGTNNIIYTTSAVSGGGYNNTPNNVRVTALTANTAWIQFTATHKNYGVPGTDEEDLAPITQRFTVTKNPSLISHSLRLNSFVSNRDSNDGIHNTYTPSIIEVDAITRTGGGVSSYRTAGIIKAKIYYVNDTAESIAAKQYISNSNGQPLNIILQDDNNYGPISYIETYLGTEPNWDDRQKIVITTNGRQGVDAWSVNLINDFDMISTTYDYKVTKDFMIQIPFEIMEGIVLKNAYYYNSDNGNNYPQVKATAFTYKDGSTILPIYYYDNEIKESGNLVNNIRFNLTKTTNKSIGDSGVIELTFKIDATHTITKVYHYKSQPEALDAIKVQLYADPNDTFENQSGKRIIRPIIISGLSDLTNDTNIVTKFTWYIYDNNISKWKKLTNSASGSDSEKKYIEGVATGNEINGEFNKVENGRINSKLVEVTGIAINGYATFRLDVTIVIADTTQVYSEYISLKDISDPIQVFVLSTVGHQIVNGQGIGVIYARALKDGVELDPVVSDNLLGVGTIIPSNNINTGVFEGKTGYVYLNLSNGSISYYYRTDVNSNWTPRSNTTANYKWSFRDENNVPITTDYEDWNDLHTHLQYVISNSINTQFIYVDEDVIKNRLIADVQVKLDL